jgi:hypothetical protein
MRRDQSVTWRGLDQDNSSASLTKRAGKGQARHPASYNQNIGAEICTLGRTIYHRPRMACAFLLCPENKSIDLFAYFFIITEKMNKT